jgi:RNA polymerase sigma-70 factor, ECF subfamily
MPLFNRCARRVPGAWDEFIDQYNKLIYYSIHRTLNIKHYNYSPDEIDDLFNDVLVHLIKDDSKKLRQYKGYEGASEATWIRTITVRFVIDYLRQRSRRQHFVDISKEDIMMEISSQNPVTRPDEDYEAKEQIEVFNELMNGLEENDRHFMELYYVRGLSVEDTALTLDISTKTVYSRINRIKGKLKKNLKKKGRN